MSRLDTTELEQALEQTLPELAVAPSGGLLERTLRQVAATPQRMPSPFRLPRPTARPGWSSIVVAAAAALAGIVVGGSAVLLIADPPPASPPSASASPESTATVEGSPTVTPMAMPSDGQASPYAWERIDMPDPAVGMLGGGLPQDVIVFGGEYVVVGSLRAACASDITLPPPNCEEVLSELTSDGELQSAVVWTSGDGRTWELVPEQAAFDLGAMHHAATDGQRIVVAGRRGGPSITERHTEGPPAIWVSDDGRAWELADTGDVLPEHIASTANGFVGARNTDEGPQFFASDDGRAWDATTTAGDHGLGQVEDLAVGEDGNTIVAVGYHEVVNADGLLDSSTAAAWKSPDGRSWERAPDQEAFVIGSVGGTHMFAVAHTASSWVALGLAPNDGEYDSGAWTSPDGLRWTRIPAIASPTGLDATVSGVTWTGEELVATGTISGEGGSVVAMWLSADGTEWNSVSGQPALTEGSPAALIAQSGVVLAVGARQTETDHWVGVVWIASR